MSEILRRPPPAPYDWRWFQYQVGSTTTAGLTLVLGRNVLDGTLIGTYALDESWPRWGDDEGGGYQGA